jgi:hypothetical protein
LRAATTHRLQFDCNLAFDVVVIATGAGLARIVGKIGPSGLVDRSNGKFGVLGRAELARQDNVQISIKALRDYLGHGHGTARYGHDQRIPATPFRQRLGQQLSSFDSAVEDHPYALDSAGMATMAM